jgi:A/G-specific adenine glycosylase
MLQQTQASVVISYFLRWMEQFPTIEVLARAPLDAVIKVWEGLGYYSRARHLHQGAQEIVARYGGQLPSSYEELIGIKGLGRYTAGAILSFAFRKRQAALDGNGIRVLTRYLALDKDVCKSSTQKQLWEEAERMLPAREPWLVVEGLIELGATVCKKVPLCEQCPLQAGCLARRQGNAQRFPIKEKRVAVIALTRFVFVIEYAGRVLVKRGQEGQIMADLYEFPFAEGEKGEIPFEGLKVKRVRSLPSIVHHFTRFKATLYPELWQLEEAWDLAGYEWVDLDKLGALAFSSGHRKIREYLIDYAPFTY